ncbi:MAG: two-component system, chemotaxis family, chemotaxis protein CheY [Clostridiales bacterium]|jgi:two-component system chemotaxis response regulator CheY|nr:two-component system, chemotaxis family, chemotaxis protein CheY [Clostridiales bacterium]
MRKIMIVDDSLIIRINLKKLFEKNGFEVVAEATNGREAVEKYIIFQPDIITMDITMPEMDGISALEKIREIDEQIPVVMISALGQELKILEAVNKGANHFIVKPFQEIDVINKIEHVINTVQGAKLNAVISG